MRLSYLTSDLLFSSQVTAQAGALGMEIDVVASAQKLVASAAGGDALVLIDLSQPGLDVTATVEQLQQLENQPAAILAYAPHVHAEKIAAAQAAGCDQVLTRGQMHAQAGQLLQQFCKS